MLLVSLTSTAAFGQGMPNIPQMDEVSGKYSNDDVGVRIEFPFGWSGIAMQIPAGTIATVAPGGMESGEPSQIMTLAMIERTNAQPKDPSEFTQQDSECDAPTVKQITVSGAAASESTMTCTGADGKEFKVKIVAAQTETHWISAMFMAPALEFDSSVSKFDSSVSTLNILNVENMEGETETTDDTTPETTEQPAKLESRNVPVSVGGKNVDVLLESSSSITKFGLDEETKKISFTADGDNAGTTNLSLGNVLKGPFVVMVDGEVTQDFTTDEQGQTLEMTYSSGNHEISISGTQVVPEFPLGVVAVIATLIGIVAILGRTKLFSNYIKY
jgi:hypothetical protein